MTTALQSLDAFLESPESQRDITRAVRVQLDAVRSMTVVFGDAPTAASPSDGKPVEPYVFTSEQPQPS